MIRHSQKIRSNSKLAKLLRLCNDVLKPKLNDYKIEEPITTTQNPFYVHLRPEPFKNSFTSLSDVYLDEYTNYKISIQYGSVLKVTRQIANYKVNLKIEFTLDLKK